MNLALELLEKAARQERLAHLLLLHGGSSAYRRQIAMRLAQILNCLHPDHKPCQVCAACRKIESGNHPDVAVLVPAKASFGIEQVLSWQKTVYRRHYEGRYKVFIFEQTEDFTPAAANALLKVVEEPPERTIMVFNAANAESLLPTVRSRAMEVFLPPVSIEAWLAGSAPEQQADAAQAAALSGSSVELAAGLLANGVSKVKDWLAGFWQAVAEGDFLKLFPLFPVEKEEAELYLQVLAGQIRDRLGNMDPDLQLPGILTGRNAVALQAVGESIADLGQTTNTRLVLEVLALRLMSRGGVVNGGSSRSAV